MFICPKYVNFFIFVHQKIYRGNLKKILIYSILILFLFNSIGYYLLYELKKHLARTEMQAIIQHHSKKLTVLTIADDEHDPDFQRIDKKEFMYKGSMYDIVREIRTGHKTVFICLHDSKESKLLAGMKRLNQNKLHFAVWNHLTMIFLPIPAGDLNLFFSGKLLFPRIEISLRSSFLQTWSPPPEHS